MTRSPDRPGHQDAAPSLVGRGRELATLRTALDAARAGSGSLVLIGGAAGIGKTTLAELLLAEAEAQGVLALAGRCYDLSETPPYGPWREALGLAPCDATLPPLPAAVLPVERAGDALGSQEAILARVQAYLTALSAQQPVLILLDDLHWADPVSLDLLRFVGRQLVAQRLLVLATYRADELTRRHPLYAVLPALVREARAARLDLRPLNEEALRALVARYTLADAQADQLVAYLRARSEGNPLFASELLRALEEEQRLSQEGAAGWALGDLASLSVPPLLRQVIDERLDRLGEAARGLLAVAAVIGQHIPLDLWGSVAAVADEQLLGLVERAAEARVLVATEEGARFAHALIREALYEGMLPPRRRTWHRRIAELLAARPGPDPDAVAYHFRRAHDPRAVPWLLQAADRAERAYAWLAAADRLEAALALLDDGAGGARERGPLLVRLGLLQRYANPARGLAYLGLACEAAAAAGNPVLAAYALYCQGQLRLFVGEYRHGLAEQEAGHGALVPLLAAEAGAGAPAPRPWLRDAASRQAGLLDWSGGLGKLDRALAIAAAIAPDPGAAPAAPEGQAGLGIALAALGRPGDAARAFDRECAGQRARGNHRQLGFTALHEYLSLALPFRADDPEYTRRLAATIEEAWRRCEGVMPAAWLPLGRVPLLLHEGRWVEVRNLGLSGRIAHRSLATIAAALLGPLARAQGDAALAWSCVRDVLRRGPDTAPGDAWFIPAIALQTLAAALALDADDLPLARAWLETHERWLAWAGATLGRAEGQLGWAAYHRANGDAASARAHAEQALAHAEAPRQARALLATRRLLGELATEAGQQTVAAEHLAAALALADACAAPHERARTLLSLAELQLAAGEQGRARAAIDDARALLEPLEAQPALARADALAARLARESAPAVAPPPGAYPAGLSAREVEVLRLVAAGLTNAQAAERLFVSSRTVEQHLRSVYNKLGVASRAAAAAFAAEHGLR